MDVNGQWRFGREMVTDQVPCPKCGAAAGEPCDIPEIHRQLRGLLHGCRTAEIVEEIHKPTGLSSNNRDISIYGKRA